MAIGVLNCFEKHTRENIVDVLVMRYMRDLNMDCLELAVRCKCKNFVSHQIVQAILDNIWVGRNVTLLENVLFLIINKQFQVLIKFALYRLKLRTN